MQDDIEHLNDHAEHINNIETFANVVHSGGDQVLVQKIDAQISKFQEYLTHFDEVEKVGMESIEEDILIQKNEVFKNIEQLFSRTEKLLKEDYSSKNKKTRIVLNQGLESLKNSKNKILELDLKGPKEMFEVMCSLVEEIPKFKKISTDYLQKCNYLDKLLKEDLDYQYYSQVESQIEDVSSIMSHFDAMHKYSKLEIKSSLQKSIDDYSSSVEEAYLQREHFAPASQILPKPRVQKDEEVEQVSYELVELREKKSLVISTVKELKDFENLEVDKINDLRLLFQQ